MRNLTSVVRVPQLPSSKKHNMSPSRTLTYSVSWTILLIFSCISKLCTCASDLGKIEVRFAPDGTNFEFEYLFFRWAKMAKITENLYLKVRYLSHLGPVWPNSPGLITRHARYTLTQLNWNWDFLPPKTDILISLSLSLFLPLSLPPFSTVS